MILGRNHFSPFITVSHQYLFLLVSGGTSSKAKKKN
jgi:hypothetical protein